MDGGPAEQGPGKTMSQVRASFSSGPFMRCNAIAYTEYAATVEVGAQDSKQFGDFLQSRISSSSLTKFLAWKFGSFLGKLARQSIR